MRQIFSGVISLLILWIGFGMTTTAEAIAPTDVELAAGHAFASAKFDGIQATFQVDNSIEVIENHDPVIQNASWLGTMCIGSKSYTHGLFCHAPSKLIVRTSKPVQKFTADVGIDRNASTNMGAGSVQFIVQIGEEELFHSETISGTPEAMPVSLDMRGVKEFTLAVNDSGNGISCDQADWANALVRFDDGTTAWLGDMLITNQMAEGPEIAFPFSFVYHGVHSSTFIKDWTLERGEAVHENGKIKRTLTFTEPNGALQIYCDVTEYEQFPHVEWVLRFKNISDHDTPMIENILPLDIHWARGEGKEFLLHHAVGSPSRQDDYMPLETALVPNMTRQIATSGGRGTDENFAYFNLECGRGEGAIIAVGWPGQWSSSWTRDSEKSLHVTAGQELTHFVLHSGEEVRTPMIVVQPWKRPHWIDAQNVWRGWMIAHNVPRMNGQIVDHQMGGCSSQQFREMAAATAEDQKHFIDRYLEEGIQLDYWWMDAGWYPCGASWFSKLSGEWPKVGTWKPDPRRFPNGLREVNEYAEEKNLPLGNVVWFEPERVHPDTWLTKNHPEWVHGGANGGLLKLENPEVLNWAIETFDGLIKSQKIRLYRQDYNIAPLGYWRANDSEDRQGITEIQYVTNYLKYWDTLLERNPGLRIDSCASGGRRNDLETMRRAVPLHRSDYIHEPTGQQIHTYGISMWIPVYGSCVNQFNDYEIRSTWIPCINLCYDVRKTDSDYANLKKNIALWQKYLTPYYLGDYYPLTDISTSTKIWVGWQFNALDGKSGAIQMFRRPDSHYTQGEFPLFGLDAEATYTITDVDSNATMTATGRELMDKGVKITMENHPSAVLYHYEKQ
ncbi:MAG: NPCBM/NEW2 domain-containing protein [Thermoguttaceae bacterium]|nr:NPCBM/NEW2 domain-containing protein [Thermoguttaceae bacterium]